MIHSLLEIFNFQGNIVSLMWLIVIENGPWCTFLKIAEIRNCNYFLIVLKAKMFKTYRAM